MPHTHIIIAQNTAAAKQCASNFLGGAFSYLSSKNIWVPEKEKNQNQNAFANKISSTKVYIILFWTHILDGHPENPYEHA